MIATTDFRHSGAGNLVDYIKRDDGQRVPVKDHTGRELDADRLDRFVEVSERFGIQRHIVVAPDPEADYRPAEVDRNVRATMREWRRDRQSARYVYAVHDSTDHIHAHLAVTGRERDLYMDRDDIEAFRTAARDAFREPERLARRRASATADRTSPRQRRRSTASPDRRAELNQEAPPEEPVRDDRTRQPRHRASTRNQPTDRAADRDRPTAETDATPDQKQTADHDTMTSDDPDPEREQSKTREYTHDWGAER